MSSPPRRVALAWGALAALTVASVALVAARFRLQPDVVALLPDAGEAEALRRYVRGFGGADLGAVLVRGEPEEAATAAREIADELRKKEAVRSAADRVDASRTLDPVLAFRHAGSLADAKLAEVLTPGGMRERLRESRAMLLAPASGGLADRIAEDPLRLSQLVFENQGVTAGVRTQADGAFANDDGTARLVLVAARGQALKGKDARAFVAQAEEVLGPARAAHPGLEIGLTGGHAIGAAMERMIEGDLRRSTLLASVVASALFVLLFRRVRALLAVLPPLLLGTLWTAALAGLVPGGVSAIAIGFMSVVVGVGVDTGVHVYAALLDARRAGLPPREAAAAARRETARPVLVAAVTAGAAFAALGLSGVSAMRQLGLLCAAGEVLTAMAIVAVTPEVGALLERGPPPPARLQRWTRAAAWLTGTRARAAVVAVAAALPVVALPILGGPSAGDAIVALRPTGLEPLEVQRRIFEAFGGRSGQWVVLVGDRSRDEAMARADRLADALAKLPEHVEALDALAAILPAPATQAARFDARDRLDLPAKAAELEKALVEIGFAPEPFAPALAAMRAPRRELLSVEDLAGGLGGLLLDRFLGKDGDEHLAAVYVRPREGAEHASAVEAAVREVDPGARVTGYARLERTLKETLAADLPRVGLVASALVLVALVGALRRPRDVLLAACVVVSEIAIVLAALRVLSVPLHVYDALVLPVLLGVTVDEGMFLLHRAGRSAGPDAIRDTLASEGPPIAATALTTAAGFASLALCRFDGLRDLGRVGALGSVIGLFVALLVVPAGLRLLGGGAAPPKS